MKTTWKVSEDMSVCVCECVLHMANCTKTCATPTNSDVQMFKVIEITELDVLCTHAHHGRCDTCFWDS